MLRDKDSRIDYGIILSVLLLFIISITTLYSATNLIADAGPQATLIQIAGYIVGALLIVIIMQFSSERLWKMTPYLYWGGMVLLVLVLFFHDRGLAASTGARSWFLFGPVSFQPSEIVKIFYILQLAQVVTKHNGEYPEHTTKSDWNLLMKIAIYSAIPMFLILLQNDFGTMLVYLAIMVGVILMSGIGWNIILPFSIVALGISALLIFLVVYNREILYAIGFQDYQFSRIDSWLDPFHDTSNASYQLVQALKAIGSGQVLGKGFGISEVYVPVRESDMIFTVIAENFGFVGSAFLVLVYFVLIYRMITVVFDTRNEFYTYIATGVIMMVLFHVLENIGMNLGILPLTGIPLPFISQGGSSLLSNMMGIGLIMSMRYNSDDYKNSEIVES